MDSIRIYAVFLICSSSVSFAQNAQRDVQSAPRAAQQGAPHDALRTLLDQYVKASTDLRSSDAVELKAFYRKWLQKIRTALDSSPKSPSAAGACEVLVSLANGLEEWNMSAAFAQQAIAHTSDPWRQAIWRTDRANALLEADRGASPQAHTSEAIAELQRALSVFRDPKNVSSSAVVSLGGSSEHSVDFAVGRMVEATHLLARALGDRLADPIGAAEELRRTRDSVTRLRKPNTARPNSNPLGISPIEDLAASEAKRFAQAGGRRQAFKAIDSIFEIAHPVNPPSMYAEIACDALSKDGVDHEAFINAAEAWLASRPADGFTPMLTSTLAFHYCGAGQVERAVKMGENVLNHYENQLRAWDQKRAPRDGRGRLTSGQYSGLLGSLVVWHDRLGNHQAAERYLHLLEQEFPWQQGTTIARNNHRALTNP